MYVAKYRFLSSKYLLLTSVVGVTLLYYGVAIASEFVDEIAVNHEFATAQELIPESYNFSMDIGDKEEHYSRLSLNTSQVLPHVTVNGTGDGSTYDYYRFQAYPGDRVIIDLDHVTANRVALRLYDENQQLIPIRQIFNDRAGASGSDGVEYFHPSYGWGYGHEQGMIVFDVSKNLTGPQTYYIRTSFAASWTVSASFGYTGYTSYKLPADATYKLHLSVGSRLVAIASGCMVSEARSRFVAGQAKYNDCDGDGLADDWEVAYAGESADLMPGADDDGDGFSNLEEYINLSDPRVRDLPLFDDEGMGLEVAKQIPASAFQRDYSPVIGNAQGNTSEQIPHATITVKGRDLARFDYYKFNASGGSRIIADVDNGISLRSQLNKAAASWVVVSHLTLLRIIDEANNDYEVVKTSAEYHRQGYDVPGGGHQDDAYLEYEVPPGDDQVYAIALTSTWASQALNPQFNPVNGPCISTYCRGIYNQYHYQLHISTGFGKNNVDTDGDGLTDYCEMMFPDIVNADGSTTPGLDPNRYDDANGDLDSDGLTNLQECELVENYTGDEVIEVDPETGEEMIVDVVKLDPRNSDSDGDRILDGEEVNNLNMNPIAKDTDGDGFEDAGEVEWGTWVVDANGDGIVDDADIIENAKLFSIGGDSETDRKIMHVLNRLTYGPTNKLYDYFASQDFIDRYDSWLNAQFSTPGINITYADGNSLNETTRRESALTNAIAYGPDSVIPPSLITVHWMGTLRQCDFKFGSGVMASDIQERAVVTKCLIAYQNSCLSIASNDPAQCKRDVHRMIENANLGDSASLANMAALRAIESTQHLRAKMADFWDNHFSTNIKVLDRQNHMQSESYEADTFFMKAFGNFSDLLIESAKSPTMLQYLDNEDNKAPQAHENYAREVMELHTIGLHDDFSVDQDGVNNDSDSNYDQADVAELAKLLTGWSLQRTNLPNPRYQTTLGRYRRYSWVTKEPNNGAQIYPVHETYSDQLFEDNGIVIYAKNWPHSWFGNYFTRNFHLDDYKSQIPRFAFNPEYHLSGSKVLTIRNTNHTITENIYFDGQAQIEAALTMLAHHPFTARRICIKLINYLIKDDLDFKDASYDKNLINGCSNVYLANNSSANNDQIKQVLKYLLDSQSSTQGNGGVFFIERNRRNKAKDIAEFVYSLSRLLEVRTDELEYSFRNRPGFILADPIFAGQAPYSNPSPDGRPENSNFWNQVNDISRRMNIIYRKGFWVNEGISPAFLPQIFIAQDNDIGGYINISSSHPQFPGPAGYYKITQGYTTVPFSTALTGTTGDINEFHKFIVDGLNQVSNNDVEAKQIARYLFRMFYGGYYTGHDLQIAYQLLNSKIIDNSYQAYFDDVFLSEELGNGLSYYKRIEIRARVLRLIKLMAVSSDFNLQ